MKSTYSVLGIGSPVTMVPGVGMNNNGLLSPRSPLWFKWHVQFIWAGAVATSRYLRMHGKITTNQLCELMGTTSEQLKALEDLKDPSELTIATYVKCINELVQKFIEVEDKILKGQA